MRPSFTLLALAATLILAAAPPAASRPARPTLGAADLAPASEPVRIRTGGRIVFAEAFCAHSRFVPKELGDTPCRTAGSFLIVRTRSRALVPVRCNHADQPACIEAGHGVGRRVHLRGGMVAGVLFTDSLALFDP